MSRHRALEAAERRQRENSAARLKTEYPDLQQLRLVLREMRGKHSVSDSARPILVQTAPDHFEIPCGDESCKAGGHDITWDVRRALSTSQAQFEGTSDCQGQLGSTTCSRVLHYTGTAKYQAQREG